MTAKRFTYDYEDDKYYDKDFFKDNGKELYKDELLELLNTLHEENEQLKTKNFAYIQDIEVFKEENTHLKLENEELKDFAQHNYSETKKIINNLQKENEQLKQQMQKKHKLINSKIQSARELGSVRTVIVLKNLQRKLNGDIE